VSGPNKGSSLLDASAVLAVLFAETGAAVVEAAGPGLLISAVNAEEVLSKLVRSGMPLEAAVEALESLDVEVIPYGAAEAAQSARLATSKALSLGDRACLGTALLRQCQVLTADRQWKRAAPGVAITYIR
jgi:ribonuclease VapC